MYVYFECDNGHRLKAHASHRGRGSKCPRCQAEIVVPERQSNPVTDSGIARLLGTPEPQESREETRAETSAAPSATATASSAKTTCPRCSAIIAASSRSCDQCGLYITVNASAWDSVLKTANRYVRAKRGA
jgi:hypothetical protein